MFKACIGLNCARQIDFIDRRGCQLMEIPDDIYRHEGYLEELLLDSNQIQELPPKLFRLTNLRKLTLSENDLMRLPPMIANFGKLTELDISKNCVEEIPSNIQFCRSLSFLDVSCNPLMRIPDCVANVGSLTQLFLNDVALPALPREIGNLQNLIILEARENLLRRIPLSIGELKKLQRLDLGNNEIEALPSSIGFLVELQELWLDTNCLSLLPEELSNLRNLTVLDVTKNKLERLPSNFACLVNLCDLHASENCIEVLPDDFGSLRSLTQLKLDLNHLIVLPDSIGDIPHLTEVFLFENMLDSIPSSLFTVNSLELLNLDRNHLVDIPSNVGLCKSLHILSMRENDITFLPEEIGQLDKLRVLDISGNRITHLPLTLSNLNLDALWVSGNQLQPLVSLQQVADPENPDKRVLTCQYLPQKGQYGSELDYSSDLESEDGGGTFQRKRTSSLPTGGQLSVAFEPGTAGLPPVDDSTGGKLVRFPTPFRKDLKNRHKKPKLDARPRTTVFRKGSMDDLTLHAVDVTGEPSPSLVDPSDASKATSPITTMPPTPSVTDENDKKRANMNGVSSPDTNNDNTAALQASNLLKTKGVINLSADYLADESEEKSETQENNEEGKTHPKTRLQTIEVIVDLIKDPARGLGFSIAGGKGSTPAYEDVDESIFITRIIRGGMAEKDGRLRLGDKVLSVNDEKMINATHMQAVTALRNSHKKCVLKVSREVLIVLPDNVSFNEESFVLDDAQQEPSIEQSVESLASSSVPKSTVTEESTGQRMEPVADDSGRTESETIVNQNGNGDIENARMSGNSSEVLNESPLSESKRTPVRKRNGNGDSGEAVLLDSDKEDTAVASRGGSIENGIEVVAELNNEFSIETDNILDQEIQDEEDDTQSVPEQDRNGYINTNSDDSGLATPDFSEETVILDRSIPALGMSIVGGIDYSSKIFGCGQPGIYISKVTEGGSAAATGRLRMGDKILKVNGIDMEMATHEEAVMCLVSQEGNIELLVRHDPPPPGMQEVIITKGDNKLGVSIKGGGPESIGNPFDPSDEGIFISKISKGGMAEADGRLQIGQRILEVDSNSLLGASHVEAVHILRQTGNTVRLLVCDGYGIYKNGPARNIDKDLRAGSMELLDQTSNSKKVLVKRTHSTASSDALRSKVLAASSSENSAAEFTRVIEDLTRYKGTIANMTLPEKRTEEEEEEAAAKEEETISKDNIEDEGVERDEESSAEKDEQSVVEKDEESAADKDEETNTTVEADDDKKRDTDTIEVPIELNEVPADETTLDDSIIQMEEMKKLAEEELKHNLEDNTNNNNRVPTFRRESADEVARKRAEKQEELKSIISEVFSDIDDWDILDKAADENQQTSTSDIEIRNREDDTVNRVISETVMSPPSASELSNSSPISNPDITITVDSELNESEPTVKADEDKEDEEKNDEKNNEETEVIKEEPKVTEEDNSTEEHKEYGNDEMGTVSEPIMIPMVATQDESFSHAHSVPPTPTRPHSQKEWYIERPMSAQGKSTDKLHVYMSQKPGSLKSPEKLSFRDKLALHQKKVETVSKVVEDELRFKRRSWAPGSSPFSSRSNTTSPVVSPTHKQVSSVSLGAPPILRVNRMSPEQEERRLNRHTTRRSSSDYNNNSQHQHDESHSSLPFILSSNPILLTTDNPQSSFDDTITDTPHSPAPDPPLTDSSDSSINGDNDIDDVDSEMDSFHPRLSLEKSTEKTEYISEKTADSVENNGSSLNDMQQDN